MKAYYEIYRDDQEGDYPLDFNRRCAKHKENYVILGCNFCEECMSAD